MSDGPRTEAGRRHVDELRNLVNRNRLSSRDRQAWDAEIARREAVVMAIEEEAARPAPWRTLPVDDDVY